jgi:hypothetical protein
MNRTAVRAVDADEQEGVRYLVMDFVDRFDLAKMTKGPLILPSSLRRKIP